jgi:SAM-dependent methyltransferase
MDICRICREPLGVPIYESSRPISITSLCQVIEGHTRVWHCAGCSHTQTAPLPTLEEFYAEKYQILTASEEEDQLYVVCDGKKIFRTEHQVATLLNKLDVVANANVLDYGCAKAATLKVLCDKRADLTPHVFDVSARYRSFWDAFVPETQQAVNQVPDAWAGRFDLVTSFFALEHVADPRAMTAAVHQLLREGGWFYFLVPNLFANTADLVVADHVNHFSNDSLMRLLGDSGFVAVDIDAEIHNSAWVITAQKGRPSSANLPTKSLIDPLTKMADFWRTFGKRVRDFESVHEGPSAIYGSGFYGAFISTCLEESERVRCFLDQNPHRQKQHLLDLPIVAPELLPGEVSSIYVGLNPRVARKEIAAMKNLQARECDFFYP